MDTLKTTLSETHNPDKTPHRIPFFIRLLKQTKLTPHCLGRVPI